MKKLSVVIPAYNEELMIMRTARTIKEILDAEEIIYELLFVDDGSRDGTWTEIEKAAGKDPCVHGLMLSRNFGKESAIAAGLSCAGGDAVAVMDCDLQHPPEKLIEMYRLWEQGYEIVAGVKKNRGKEGHLHKKGVNLFYRILSSSVGMNLNNTSDFKLMDRKVVESILSMPERNMFFRAISSWVGFKTTSVEFTVRERTAGESKWSAWSLIKYAFTNIVSFTTLPLQFVTVGGLLCLICSFILGVYSFVQYFAGHAVEGYTTILIVLLFIGSAVMVSLGIIGYYIAKIYDEVKHRPRFIVSKYTKTRQEGWSDESVD